MRTPYIVPKEIAPQLLKDAMEVAESVDVDQLDCSKSFARQATDKNIDEVIAIGLEPGAKALFNFIYRNMSFLPQEYPENCDYWDVGFTTMRADGVDYFLWIRLDVKAGWELVKKYKLEPR